ncbi:MAG: VOC family protein [Rhodospirillaceae bacterium]|nr:VOC family protein [Rhodospirillaceae bacterium]
MRSCLSRAVVVAVSFASIAMTAVAQTPPSNPVPPGFILSPLSRATIFVRDQEESLKLYRDILGLRVRADREFNDARFNQILGTQGLTIKVKILQSGDVVYGNVGLFQLVGDDRTKVPAPLQAATSVTGDAAVVFNTTDIRGINDKVKAAGYTVIAEPMVLFPNPEMEVEPLEMLFRDRDGILVNLIQPGVAKAK